MNDAANKLMSDGNAVVDWAKEVGLEVNFSKTKVMILGSNKKLRNLNNWDLPQIIIDAHITRKVYGTLNCLKHRRNILSTSTRKLLVMTTIIPIVEYCSLVLIDLSKRLDYKLQLCFIKLDGLQTDESLERVPRRAFPRFATPGSAISLSSTQILLLTFMSCPLDRSEATAKR
ncbi:Protein of unknown function [Cotesia congregata]|uniref:Uncharacterized protein n=1 Tax=Cotesia congregata TaxID=51543 RepID=A0A8J2MRE4_COTCN|nr:Protein of unknown function [Cotesia congregata]